MLRRLANTRGRPILRRNIVHSAGWTGPEISIAVVSDIHVISPWVTLDDIRRISDQINALEPDLTVLAGDYLAGNYLPGRRANAIQIVGALAALSAPLGVYAVLGNHDWCDCPTAKASANKENSVIEAFDPTTIQLLRNSNMPLVHKEHPFWMVGFDSQMPLGTGIGDGYHDPGLAFAGVPDQANSILIAHEPDYFAKGDTRPALQISGHTHGGQMNLFGWRPMTPSLYGGRFAHGHHTVDGRHLLVSGGVGFSGLPLRIAQPPEVNLITLRAAT